MSSILKISILVLFVLSGCKSPGALQPDIAPDISARNVSFKQARKDLSEAIRMEAHWKVITPHSGPKPVSLAWLMTIAQQKRDENNLVEFQQILNLISQYARLGIAQAKQAQALSLGTLPLNDLLQSY